MTTAVRDRSAQKAEYRRKNRAKIQEYQRAYRAANPDKRKAESKKYYEANAEALRKKSLDWRIANPEAYQAALIAKRKPPKIKAEAELAEEVRARLEKRRAAKRAWRQRNPEAHCAMEQNRRARKRAGGVLPADIKRRLHLSQNGACVYCRAELDVSAHLDHIMPLALGGSNTEDNVQLLCPMCNLRKNAKHPDVFVAELRSRV